MSLGPTELIDLGKIAGIVGFAGGEANLDAVVQPRGYRLLSGLKAVPQGRRRPAGGPLRRAAVPDGGHHR